MPLTNPAFPSGPYRFTNREYFIIQYRTDPDQITGTAISVDGGWTAQ